MYFTRALSAFNFISLPAFKVKRHPFSQLFLHLQLNLLKYLQKCPFYYEESCSGTV